MAILILNSLLFNESWMDIFQFGKGGKFGLEKGEILARGQKAIEDASRTLPS